VWDDVWSIIAWHSHALMKQIFFVTRGLLLLCLMQMIIMAPLLRDPSILGWKWRWSLRMKISLNIILFPVTSSSSTSTSVSKERFSRDEQWSHALLSVASWQETKECFCSGH
jgi:hypothetical protein